MKVVKRRKLVFTFVILASFIFTFSPFKVFALSPADYADNGVVYYSSVASGCSTDSAADATLTGSDNIEKELRYFVGKGLTLAQAAGIAGNTFAESGFNPAIIEGGAIAPSDYSPVNGVGFGLAQWTFTGRQAPLVALSQTSNRTIIDMGLQLDYIWKELNSNYAGALAALKANNSVDASDAAVIFHNTYEISSQSPAAVLSVRGGEATKLYNEYQGKIADGNSVSGTASSVSNTATATCNPTAVASTYAKNSIIYDVNDSSWSNIKYGAGTVGSAGSGPAAMAMAISNLTGDAVTPGDVAKYGNSNGTAITTGTGGSNDNLSQITAEHWGLNSTQLSKDTTAITQAIQAGGIVVVSGSGASPFTSQGDFIEIRAVAADGKWLIGDSNGSVGAANSADSKEWDPSFIMSEVGSYVWLINKAGTT